MLRNKEAGVAALGADGLRHVYPLVLSVKPQSHACSPAVNPHRAVGQLIDSVFLLVRPAQMGVEVALLGVNHCYASLYSLCSAEQLCVNRVANLNLYFHNLFFVIFSFLPCSQGWRLIPFAWFVSAKVVQQENKNPLYRDYL